MRARAWVRMALLAMALLAGAWTLFVPLSYALTLDDQIVSRWLEDKTTDGRLALGPGALIAFAIGQLLFVPSILWTGLVLLRSLIAPMSRFGALLGVVCGLWLSTTMLALPYIGVYPNILGALVGMVISKHVNAGPAYYLPILLTNLTVFPITGWLIFRRAGRQNFRVNSA